MLLRNASEAVEKSPPVPSVIAVPASETAVVVLVTVSFSPAVSAKDTVSAAMNVAFPPTVNFEAASPTSAPVAVIVTILLVPSTSTPASRLTSPVTATSVVRLIAWLVIQISRSPDSVAGIANVPVADTLRSRKSASTPVSANAPPRSLSTSAPSLVVPAGALLTRSNSTLPVALKVSEVSPVTSTAPVPAPVSTPD